MIDADSRHGKIRVLCCEGGRRGGSIVLLYEFLRWVDRTRFDVGVLSKYRDLMAARLFEDNSLFCRRSLNVRRDPQPDVFKHLFGWPIPAPFAIRYFLVCLAAMARHRPDILYLNGSLQGHEPAVVAARLLNIPVVCHMMITRPVTADERPFIRYVERFIAFSQCAAELYRRDLGVREEAVQAIYAGIDLAEFDRRFRSSDGPDLPTENVHVCLAGTLVARKRPLLAIEAFRLARMKCPNLRLVIAGDGPQRSEVESEIRRHQLESDVRVLGHVDCLPALLRACNIGLFVSAREGLASIVVMEYMAAGIPAVVAWLPGLEEQVRDGETALVVREPTARSVADALIRLARAPDQRRTMGEAARRMIEQPRFQVEEQIRSIERLIAGVHCG